MLVPTEALVLHAVKYGNTGLIVTMFTRELGLQSFIVQGARSTKSRNKASILQPVFLLDIVSYNRPEKNLNRLSEFSCHTIYKSLIYDVYKSSVAIFMIELLSQCIKEEETNAPLFDFVKGYLLQLDTRPFHPLLHVHFTIHLMSLLGFSPDVTQWKAGYVLNLTEGVFTINPPAQSYYAPKDTTQHWVELLLVELENIQTLTFPYATRKTLLDIALHMYMHHIPNFKTLRSIKVLEEALR